MIADQIKTHYKLIIFSGEIIRKEFFDFFGVSLPETKIDAIYLILLAKNQDNLTVGLSITDLYSPQITYYQDKFECNHSDEIDVYIDIVRNTVKGKHLNIFYLDDEIDFRDKLETILNEVVHG